MSLTKLSNELLLEIANYSGSRAAGQLVSCSKRLNSIATPIFYRHVDIRSGHCFRRLMQLIVEKPELGVYVKSVIGDLMSGEGLFHIFDMSSYTKEDYHRCKSSILAVPGLISTAGAKKWIQDLRLGRGDALFAIFLLHTPCLEEIDLESYGVNETSYVGLFLEHAASISASQMTRLYHSKISGRLLLLGVTVVKEDFHSMTSCHSSSSLPSVRLFFMVSQMIHSRSQPVGVLSSKPRI